MLVIIIIILSIISQHSANVVPEEERAHGTISAKTYLKFFKEGVKSHFVTVAVLVFFLSVEVCICVMCVHIATIYKLIIGLYYLW